MRAATCRAEQSRTTQVDMGRKFVENFVVVGIVFLFGPVGACEWAESTALPWAVCHRGEGLRRVRDRTRLSFTVRTNKVWHLAICFAQILFFGSPFGCYRRCWGAPSTKFEQGKTYEQCHGIVHLKG